MSAEISKQPTYRIVVVDILNGLVRRIAEFTAWFNVLVIAVIMIQVTMRYGFNRGLVPLEELIWHFYAVAFMFGIAYAVTTDSHLRVDLVHMMLPRRIQHIFEIIGILLLMMPALFIIFDHSLGWALHAFQVNESSRNPTGLPYRWVIKSVVPMSMLLIFIAALARLIQETLLLFHHGKEVKDDTPVNVSMMRHLFMVRHCDLQNSDGGEKNNGT